MLMFVFVFVFMFFSRIGKSACDAIGASVKRLIRRHAIQGNKITTPLEFFDACKKLDSKIVYEFCSNDDVTQAEGILNRRYENMKIQTIVGTHQFHGFIPSDSQTMSAKMFSFSRISKKFVVAKPIPLPRVRKRTH